MAGKEERAQVGGRSFAERDGWHAASSAIYPSFGQARFWAVLAALAAGGLSTELSVLSFCMEKYFIHCEAMGSSSC